MYFIKSFCSLILWIKFFFYVRIVPQLSYLVRSILEIAKGLVAFIFMYGIACLAFADAFHTASDYN